MTYKNVYLDDSILDIDSWLPENAVDNIVQLIMQQEEICRGIHNAEYSKN